MGRSRAKSLRLWAPNSAMTKRLEWKAKPPAILRPTIFISRRNSSNLNPIPFCRIFAQPNNFTFRRSHWIQILRFLTLDPQNANVIRDLLYVYCAMRNWPSAEATAQQLIALTPDSINAKAQLGYVGFWKDGNTARLKSELATIPVGKDPDGAVTAFR